MKLGEFIVKYIPFAELHIIVDDDNNSCFMPSTKEERTLEDLKLYADGHLIKLISIGEKNTGKILQAEKFHLIESRYSITIILDEIVLSPKE